MKRRGLALFFAFVLIVSLTSINSSAEIAKENFPVSAKTTDTAGYTEIVSNSLATLFVDVKTANVIVLDKATNQKWTAFPEDDDIARSSTFAAMLNVTYKAADGVEATVQAPSKDTGFEIKKIDNAVKIIFNISYETADFSVPVRVSLDDSFIEASILYSEIKENAKSQITDIELFPNLMYGKSSDEGYVFIPDGSGAIINYSDSLSRNETYSAKIYGRDPSQDLIYPVISDAQTARLPVYGAVKDKSALFAIITKGDLYAEVNAEMAGNTLTACSRFVFCEHDMTGIQSSSGGDRTLDILQSKPVMIEPTVRYYLLSGESASYSGMANLYRDYLIDTGVLKEKQTQTTPAVSVMVFGAVPEKKVVLGIPVTTVRKATDFDDLSKLYKTLTEAGEQTPSFFLYGFLKGGYGAKTVTNENFIGKLGGKKGYSSFKKLVGDDNLYTVYNIERSYGRAFDFLRFNDYVCSLNQTVVEQHYRWASSGLWNTKKGSWKFYTVKYQQKLITKLLNKLPANTGIVLEHYGEELISDFASDGGTSRGAYLEFINKAMTKANKKGVNIALEGGNACVAGLADEIYSIPLNSSNCSIESYSVPFYTMVLHSYKKLSSAPVNFEEDAKAFSLKAFEQGISATYAVTGCDSYQLKDTVLNFLYNSKMDNLLTDMKVYSKDYNEIHTALADKEIVKHKYSGDISVTEYENGWQLAVNYGEKDAIYQNQTIKSYDYIVLK